MSTSHHPMDPVKRQLTDDKANSLLKFNEVLRQLDREVPAQVISCFFYIAAHNPCHKQALEEDLGITTSSASRNIDWLSRYHRLRKPGLGLIEKTTDPSNHRRIICSLTPKGVELIQTLKNTL